MTRTQTTRVVVTMTIVAVAVAATFVAEPAALAAVAPAASAFDRFKGLEGSWIDLDGTFGVKGEVAATYRLTGNGSALIETLFLGSPHEMTTVYHRDGNDIVLTHYCAGGNQPRMRAKAASGSVVAFEFDGGTNVDPAKDDHMHSARFDFVAADEIRGEWNAWAGGKPNPEHSPRFHLGRKK